MNVFEKSLRFISRRLWNHTVHHIVLEAMKKNIINSHQGHAILGAWNANCFPERGYRSFLHEGGRTPRALAFVLSALEMELLAQLACLINVRIVMARANASNANRWLDTLPARRNDGNKNCRNHR